MSIRKRKGLEYRGLFARERQVSPSLLRREGYTLFRTKKLNDAHSLVLACKPNRRGCRVQSILHRELVHRGT